MVKAEFVVIQDRLKSARNVKKITQRELAEICDISEKTIHRAENEAEKVEFETLLLIAQKLEIKIDGYLYKKAFSLDETWNLMEEISKGYVLKIHPVNFDIEKLDIVIRIVEILERDLKIETNSIKLRVQRTLILENEKLKQLGGRGYYTVFTEENVRVLNLYFLESSSKKIKKDEDKEYIEVFKELEIKF